MVEGGFPALFVLWKPVVPPVWFDFFARAEEPSEGFIFLHGGPTTALSTAERINLALETNGVDGYAVSLDRDVPNVRLPSRSLPPPQLLRALRSPSCYNVALTPHYHLGVAEQAMFQAAENRWPDADKLLRDCHLACAETRPLYYRAMCSALATAPPRAPPRLTRLDGTCAARLVTLWIHGYQTDGDLVRLSYFEDIPKLIQRQRPGSQQQVLFRYGAHLTVAQVGVALVNCITSLGASLGDRMQLEIRAHSMGGLVFAAAINHTPTIVNTVGNAIFYDCPFVGFNFAGLQARIDELKKECALLPPQWPPRELKIVEHRLKGYETVYDSAARYVENAPLLDVLRPTNAAALELLRAPIEDLAARVLVVMCPVRDSQAFPEWKPQSAELKPIEISGPKIDNAGLFGDMLTHASGHVAMFQKSTELFHVNFDAAFLRK
jgi:hypothetical protein